MASRTVDMSPEAVSRRLEELAQRYEMALSPKRARVIGPARAAGRSGRSSGQPAPRPRECGPVEGPHQHPLILAASVLVNNDRTLGDATYEVRRVRFFAATRPRAVGAFFQRRS
jgi:hypothetical protein